MGGQGDGGTRGQGDGGQGDKGTRGQGDKGTRGQGEVNCQLSTVHGERKFELPILLKYKQYL